MSSALIGKNEAIEGADVGISDGINVGINEQKVIGLVVENSHISAVEVSKKLKGRRIMSDVFIIGAGCSVPYEFPTGTMLMEKLKSFDYSSTVNKRKYAKVYATAVGLSSQNRLRISTYLDLKDFEKRNEPEPMLEIENRILKDASAVDLILDYYTLA